MFTGKVNFVIKTIKDRKVGAKNMEPLFAVIAFDPCFCSIFLIHSATLLVLCIFTFLFCGMCSFSFFLSVPFRMIYFSFHSPCFFFQSLFLCLLFVSFLCLPFPLLSSCSFFSCFFLAPSFSSLSPTSPFPSVLFLTSMRREIVHLLYIYFLGKGRGFLSFVY